MKQYNPNKQIKESMIGRDGGKIVLPIIGSKFTHKTKGEIIEPHDIKIKVPLEEDGNHLYFYYEGQEPYLNDRNEECRHGYYIHICNFIENYSPLQIGEEYYLVEEFMYAEVAGDSDDYGNSEFWIEQSQDIKERNKILYKLDLKNIKNEGVFFDEDELIMESSSQMQLHQSRLKFKVTNVEVKRCDDLSHEELKGIIDCNFSKTALMYEFFKDTALHHDDYIFLIDWKKIK